MSSKKTSSELDGIIYGMLLGDGHVRKPTKAGTCNFILHHSKKQEEYLKHKLNLLEEISHVKTNYWEKSTKNKKNNKIYYSIYAQTNFLNYFRKLRNIFYTPNKRVTLEILEKLTPQGLALWWMDDGCLYINRQKSGILERRAYLATHSFSLKENELIKEYFKNKFDIKLSIKYQHSSSQYFISFPIPEFKKFVNLIKPYIIESMAYKINLQEELKLKPGPKPGRAGD